MNPRFAEEAMKKNMELVDALKSLASKKNVTPAQLTLAWVIAQGCIPIPGTTKASVIRRRSIMACRPLWR